MFYVTSTYKFLYILTDLEILKLINTLVVVNIWRKRHWSQLRMFVVYDKFAYNIFSAKMGHHQLIHNIQIYQEELLHCRLFVFNEISCYN